MDQEVAAGQAAFRSLILSSHDTGHQRPVGDSDLLGNRPRHEPLSDRRASRRLGRPVSGPERECRQAQILAPAQRRALAQDHARPMRLGGQAKEGQLLQGAVQPAASRRGPKKAICAVAASMLTAIYHMLKDGTEHQDLGADHFDRRPDRSQSQASRRSTRQARLPRRTTTYR